jgi:hypothetical protein
LGDLAKLTEQLTNILLAYAKTRVVNHKLDPVLNRDRFFVFNVVNFSTVYLKGHVAFFCELNTISGEVDQDLSQASVVRVESQRYVFPYIMNEIHFLFQI